MKIKQQLGEEGGSQNVLEQSKSTGCAGAERCEQSRHWSAEYQEEMDKSEPPQKPRAIELTNPLFKDYLVTQGNALYAEANQGEKSIN